MSVVGGPQIPIEVIGGLVTDFDPQDLPPGVSPDCPDCAFKPGIPGDVHTRPGTSVVATPAGDAQYNYFKTYVDSQGNNRDLYLMDNKVHVTPPVVSEGILFQEFPDGVFTQVNQFPQSTYLAPHLQAKSDTAFGREFIGFSDGLHGLNIPRQWDGTNFDRVSQCGPGAGPVTARDYNVVAITALSRTSGIISGSTDNPHLLTVGSLVNIVGVQGDGTFDGQFPVITTPTATDFTAWGNPGTYAIVTLNRILGTVTTVLNTTPSFAVGDQIIIASASDDSFDGLFTVLTIFGNIVTWAQAGVDGTALGGTLYTQTISYPILQIVYNTATSVGHNSAYMATAPGQQFPFTPGGAITITGNGDSAFNDTFPVIAVSQVPGPSPFEIGTPQSFRFINLPGGSILWGVEFDAAITGITLPLGTGSSTLPDASPSPVSGVAGPAGNVTLGEHQISISFIMRSGYKTQPSPPVPYVALGGFQLQLMGLPLGQAGGAVKGRIILATASSLDSFFYSQNKGPGITAMEIDDNVTTTAIIDFSDVALLNAVSGDYLFELVELGEVAGFLQFANRMLAWGERNWQKNWQNLSFDGGFDNATGTIPLGWFKPAAPLLVPGPSGARGDSPVWGELYSVTGDGISLHVGSIAQSAYLDPYMVPRILPNTAYSVRVLLRRNSLSVTPTQGTASIRLQSSTLGLFAGFDVPLTSLPPNHAFAEFIGVLTTGLPIVPPDLNLWVSGEGTPTNGAIFDFENIEIFPTLQPFNDDILYGSSVELPENFDGTLGIQTIAAGDGRRITTTYPIRDRLYITKNGGGLYEETADATAPFSQWDVGTISRRIGCESLNGVGGSEDDTGEDWVFLMDKKGLYIHWAAQPVKVSQEIQPTWDRINWDAAYLGWLLTDVSNRRVLISVPIDDSPTPNVILMMDYNLAGSTAQEIAESAPVSPTFTGQLKAHMRSRKWSIWNLICPGGALISRDDGTTHTFLSNGVASGDIYDLLDSNLVDVEGPIDAYYETNPYPSDEQKATILQSKGNIVLLRYLSLQIAGQGMLAVTAYGPNRVNLYSVPVVGAPPIVLESVPAGDAEMFFNFQAERMSLKIQALQNGETPGWFSLKSGELYVAQSPTAAIRGFNNYNPKSQQPQV